MFEEYWFQHGASSSIVISGWQRMSYFAQNKHVWFMEHELDHQIRALHQLVGNAVTEGRHIVVGTGSTQLFQATLYALTSHDQPAPTSVVSAAPFYSVCVPPHTSLPNHCCCYCYHNNSNIVGLLAILGSLVRGYGVKHSPKAQTFESFTSYP